MPSVHSVFHAGGDPSQPPPTTGTKARRSPSFTRTATFASGRTTSFRTTRTAGPPFPRRGIALGDRGEDPAEGGLSNLEHDVVRHPRGGPEGPHEPDRHPHAPPK